MVVFRLMRETDFGEPDPEEPFFAIIGEDGHSFSHFTKYRVPEFHHP